jgi:hypothetical protein
MRETVGVILRLPAVIFLAAAWVWFVWWWLAPGAIILAGLALLLIPVAYPFVYAAHWLVLAFQNSHDSVVPNYWKGYPDDQFSFAWKGVKLGWRSLGTSLVDGFSKGYSWWR